MDFLHWFHCFKPAYNVAAVVDVAYFVTDLLLPLPLFNISPSLVLLCLWAYMPFQLNVLLFLLIPLLVVILLDRLPCLYSILIIWWWYFSPEQWLQGY